MFFGGGFGRRRARAGRGHARSTGRTWACASRSTFGEAAFGVRRDLEVDRLAVCETCGGNGAAPGTAPVACRTCAGAVRSRRYGAAIFGTVMTAAPCDTCRGTGQEIPDKCEACFGEGRRRTPATVTVDIPAGVSDGMELRVTGSGHAGVAGGPAGDLYVSISVEPSLAFDRRGQDLFTVLDITMTQAALGARGRHRGPRRHRAHHASSRAPTRGRSSGSRARASRT